MQIAYRSGLHTNNPWVKSCFKYVLSDFQSFTIFKLKFIRQVILPEHIGSMSSCTRSILLHSTTQVEQNINYLYCRQDMSPTLCYSTCLPQEQLPLMILFVLSLFICIVNTYFSVPQVQTESCIILEKQKRMCFSFNRKKYFYNMSFFICLAPLGT